MGSMADRLMEGQGALVGLEVLRKGENQEVRSARVPGGARSRRAFLTLGNKDPSFHAVSSGPASGR